MAAFRYAFDPEAWNPQNWDDYFGGPQLVERGRRLPRDPSQLAIRGARAARSIPVAVAGLSRLVHTKWGTRKKKIPIRTTNQKKFVDAARKRNQKNPKRKNLMPYKKSYRGRRKRKFKGKRRRTARAASGRRKKALSAFNRQVKRVIWKMRNVSPLQDYRLMENDRFSCVANSRNIGTRKSLTTAIVESVIDATLPVIDGVALRYNDLTTTGCTANVKTVGGGQSIQMRNNYNYSSYVNLFWFVAAQDHSISARTCYENALNKYAVTTSQVAPTGATATDLYLYTPFDVKRDMGKMWKLIDSKACIIRPSEGKSVYFKYPHGTFNVVADAINPELYAKGVSCALIVVIGGQVAHGDEADTESGNIGYTDSIVDVVFSEQWKFVVTKSIYQRKSEYSQILDTLTNPNVVQMDIEEKTDIIG